MKTKIYTKCSSALLVLVFAVTTAFAQTPPPVMSVGSTTLAAGIFTVPLNVSGFTNVGDISLKLIYDPAKLHYEGVTLNGGLVPANALTSPVTDQTGVFRFSYTSSTAIVLAAPTNLLLEVKFSAKPGVQGVPATLAFSTAQGDCDMTPPAPGVFTPPITSTNLSTYFVNGGFMISPAPPVTGAADVCSGTTGVIYSTTPGMNSYIWTVTAGGLITNGQGTNSITVTWMGGATDTITVTYTDPVTGPALNPTIYPVNVHLVSPTITGPTSGGMPATLGDGVTAGQIYSTEPGMHDYVWAVSAQGAITNGAGTNQITVTWTNPGGQQSVSVNYKDPINCTATAPTVLIINYYPFLPSIDPFAVKKFVDPLPHFAAGLRVDAKAGGNLTIKTVLVQQKALSTGTVVDNGIVGVTPGAGLGNYAAYQISKDGTNWGPAMWPAQTIETQQGNPVTVTYLNKLNGVRYNQFNILADQTLMMNGYDLTGDPLTQPYRGDIPMVVHLHGGEMPSNSDGGPSAWFTPDFAKFGPGFQHNASSVASYPNQQEATTLWYHPHDDGLTRINVYTGLAGYYFIRGADEEAAKFPGWSGDDKVREITPAGKVTTFNDTNSYRPEIEIAVQDRMFNTKGELYWPVAPTNPELHPFWTPEFIGDIMTVNGKAWPYLSVAPRKYRIRLLEGCNARMLNVWLTDTTGAVAAPDLTIIGGEGGLLESPKVIKCSAGETLLFAPGQRYDIIIDFSGVPAGTVFTMMNNAPAPYPSGDPVVVGTTDRIMQFIVNGVMVSATGGTPADKSLLPANLRPVTPLVKLTDFAGALTAGVAPVVRRDLVLNEVAAGGGPAAVLVNNAFFDAALALPNTPLVFGGPTELMQEGTTEIYKIINISADAHPIHIHLLQWQLVSRQTLNPTYMDAYIAAWSHRGLPEYPAGLGYPGGAGSPFPYDTVNSDGAIGGNPAISSYVGPVIPAQPWEQGWKDNVIVMPGEVTTFVVRVAPTDRPILGTPQQLMFPFDPSTGPGYVWHCHIVDHEDMSMMRPLMILPSALRFPQITKQPDPAVKCVGDVVTFTVEATSATTIDFQWQVSVNAGADWTNITDGAPYSGALTASLSITTASLPLNNKMYRAVLTNIDGVSNSSAALLSVNACTISGILAYNNAAKDPLAGMKVTVNGKFATTDTQGAFTITGVTSGDHAVTIDPMGKQVGGINSTDAGHVNFWFSSPFVIPNVRFLSGDVNSDTQITAADALSIQRYFVLDQAFTRPAWIFWNATGSGMANPPAFTATVNGASLANFDILGMATGDFNSSFNPLGLKSARSNVLLNVGTTRNVPANQEFELAIRSGSDMQVGAISLILNIPTDMVDVTGVTVKGSKSPATYSVKGNELRIGWNSLAAVNVRTDEDLVILKLRSKPAFVKGESVELNMDFNPLNEIADGTFEPIKEALLKSEKIVSSSVTGIDDNLGTDLSMKVYPNPFSNVATLYYSIPEDGFATLEVRNSLGVGINKLVNEYKTAGKYSLKVDAASMPEGVYIATLRLRGKTGDLVRTVKFIVNK